MCVPGLLPPAVMSSYFCKVKKRGMPVPGSPSIMSFYLLHGEKGVVCNICLYLAFPVMSFYFLQVICLYLVFLCHVFLLIAR